MPVKIAKKVSPEEIRNFDFFGDLEKRFIEIRGPNQMFWRDKTELEEFMPKDAETLLFLLRSMMIARRVEERLKGISGTEIPGSAFFGTGNEAASCGVGAAMKYEDPAFPLHRNIGCDFVRGAEALKRGDIEVPFANIFFAQYMSKANSPACGKDGNVHWGLPAMRRYPMISHLGTNVALACGAALYEKWKKSGLVSFAFVGDGATSVGDFQALNQAAAEKLPFIVIIDNNQWAYRTTLAEQTAAIPLSRKAEAFGIRGFTIDGTDILAVYALVKKAREIALSGTPVLIESATLRMAGHSVYDSYKDYVPTGDIEKWKTRDPIERLKKTLRLKNILNDETLEEMESKIKEEIDEAREWAKKSPEPKPEDLYTNVAVNPELQSFIEFLCERN